MLKDVQEIFGQRNPRNNMPVEFPAAVDLDDDDDDDDDDWVPNCSGKGSVTDVLLILFPSLLLVVPYN